MNGSRLPTFRGCQLSVFPKFGFDRRLSEIWSGLLDLNKFETADAILCDEEILQLESSGMVCFKRGPAAADMSWSRRGTVLVISCL